jgi:parallel beta-helix repeat protein
MLSRARLVALTALISVATSACISVSRAPRDYPQAPGDATALVHVAADASAASANGAPERPFKTIQAALDAAPAGAAVLIAPGLYEESVDVERSVTLRGAEGTRLGLAAFSVNIGIRGAETAARIEDLTIIGGAGAAVLVRGASARLSNVKILGTRDAAPLGQGIGVAALEGATVELEGCTVIDGSGPGVVARGADLTILDSVVDGNQGGGVLIEWAPGPVVLDGLFARNNRGFGVGIMSTKAIIARSTITETLGAGDGIVVATGGGAGGSQVIIGGVEACAAIGAAAGEDCGNTIDDNLRFGVFVDTAASGSISGNHVHENGRGGIWLQNGGGGDTIRIAKNDIASNTATGVGVADRVSENSCRASRPPQRPPRPSSTTARYPRYLSGRGRPMRLAGAADPPRPIFSLTL